MRQGIGEGPDIDGDRLPGESSSHADPFGSPVREGAFVVSRLLDRLAFLIFGQRDADARSVWFVPGNGGRGGSGGQVPPHVPYDPDWDPKNQIR